MLKGILRRKRQPEPVIVVSGLPRSGTSMLMRMLEAGGLPPLTDNLRAADDDNPRGYFEFEPVKKLKEGETDWLPQAQGKAVKIISALLPYLPPDYSYRILFLQREILEVLASQRKMLVRRGEDPNKINDADMAAYFQKHLEQVQEWLSRQNNISVLYLSYNRLIKNPSPEVEQIAQFLGRIINTSEMAAVVDPSLYRQRSG